MCRSTTACDCLHSVVGVEHATSCCRRAAFISLLAVAAVLRLHVCWFFIDIGLNCLLQHVHTQEEAMQEMEELISLDSNAMARRTNVRTRL